MESRNPPSVRSTTHDSASFFHFRFHSVATRRALAVACISAAYYAPNDRVRWRLLEIAGATKARRLDFFTPAQEPARQPDHADTKHAIAEHRAMAGLARRGCFLLSLNRRARLRASLGRGHPARQIREGLGRADGALLSVMKLFTVEAQAGHTKLHRTILGAILLDISSSARGLGLRSEPRCRWIAH